MKISRLFLAILLILILVLIVFEVSNKGSNIGEDDDERVDPGSARHSVRSTSEDRRKKTLSHRKLVDAERFRAHSINIAEGESVFLKGRNLEPDISEIIYLSAEVVVMEDGTELVRLLRKVVHSPEVASQENGVGNLFQEGEEELIVGEKEQQLRFRKLSQTIGTDIMTMETLLLEPGKEFEAVVVPGKNQLHIEGVAERGRDGKLRVRFGRLFEVAEGE